ncbi:cytochrome P450 [Mucidula mucida]|nr:cytochrome P450 [Mucidula mucida]
MLTLSFVYEHLATVLALILAVFIFAISPKWISSIDFLPLPADPTFFWGHEKPIFFNQPGRAIRNWMTEVGSTFRIKAAFGAPDILVLCDPVAITYILQKRVFDYRVIVVRPRIARLLGKGLGWVEGEDEHKRMRRLARPALTVDNIKAMSGDILEAAGRVTQDLVTFVRKQGKDSEVNIVDWTGKATLNIALLHDFEGGNNLEAQNILNARKTGVQAIARYIGFLTLMLLRRFTFLNHLPIAAIQGQSLAKRTIQDGVARELVARNRTLMDEHRQKEKGDLLTRLLLAAEEEKISRTELYEHISTFIIAGFESTTMTVGFAIWELARHPEKQRRLREELRALNGEPTYHDLQHRMEYLDAVLKETLRLYPGLPYMERTATKDDVIPLHRAVKLANGTMSKDLVVRAGQTVIIPIIAIHRQDDIWKDADTFRPERWLEKLPPSECLPAGWGNMLAFSDGPRSCVGSQLAIFNFKVILSSLIEQFSFDTPPHLKMSLKISSSLQAWVHRDEDDPGRNEIPIILHSLDSL